MANFEKSVASIASTAQLFTGLNVGSLFAIVLEGIKSFGDKKERLKALELVALVLRSVMVGLNAELKDKTDQTAIDVMKALLRINDEALLLMARTADLDGSTESIISQIRKQGQ